MSQSFRKDIQAEAGSQMVGIKTLLNATSRVRYIGKAHEVGGSQYRIRKHMAVWYLQSRGISEHLLKQG